MLINIFTHSKTKKEKLAEAGGDGSDGTEAATVFDEAKTCGEQDGAVENTVTLGAENEKIGDAASDLAIDTEE